MFGSIINRKQTLALIAGAVVAGIVAAAVPAKVIASSPTHTTLGGGGTVMRTYVVYTPRKASLTLVALGTLVTVFALRNPKTPPHSPQ